MKQRHIVTTIRLPTEVWEALRRLAQDRARLLGGRPSASGVIKDFIVTKTVAVRDDC